MIALLVLSACGGSPRPVELTGAEWCAHCRMAVSDVHFAAQIVAPGEEPRFFDDIGCLAASVAGTPAPAGALVFVADHRTGEWVVLEDAVLTRVPTLDTPMGSHIVAHASAESRAADPLVAAGIPMSLADVVPREP